MGISILETVLFLLTVSGVSRTRALKPFGIQSGDVGSSAGSSYSGTMSYDADDNVVFVTGSTYSPFFDLSTTTSVASSTSGCFLSILSIPTTDTDSPTFLYKERLGTSSRVESCSTLVRIDSSKIYLGGQSEEGGLLTSVRPSTSSSSLQYGTVLDLDVDLRLDSTTSTTLLGGRLLHGAPVQSTRAMVSESLGDSIFIVSQESDQSKQNPDFDVTQLEPNLVVYPKWGTKFVVNVMKLTHKEQWNGGSNTAVTFESPSWNTKIGTNHHPVYIGGIELSSSSSTLVVAGSAIGSNGVSIPASITEDWAGFITLLDVSNGQVMDAKRIETQANETTRIEGICKHPSKDSEIYLVGSTTGQMDLVDSTNNDTTAFVMCITLPDLTVSWTKQLDAKAGPQSSDVSHADIVGFACAVTDDGVYVGGVVKDGAAINDSIHRSAGKDDIWVGYVDNTSHDLLWVRQLGTSDDERISALQVDKDGDILVLGDSNGSFMRQKKEGDTTTDIFLLRLSKSTGEYPVPVSDGFKPSSPADTGNDIPTSSPAFTPTHPPIVTINRRPTLAPVANLTTPQANSSGESGNAGIVAVVVVLSAIGLIIGCFVYQRRNHARQLETDSSQVEQYLSNFDDVDVDLKRSATGGWHGTYVNHDGGPRYHTDNGLPDDDYITFSGGEMSPLTHSSIIQDSLFSLDDEEPVLGGPGALGRGSFHSRQSSYRGLVDVYNNYDLSHHRLPSVRSQAMVDIDIDEVEDVKKTSARWGREII